MLRDEINFEPPLGFLGRLLVGRYLMRKLSRTFDYRHEKTQEILESGEFSMP